MIVFTNLLTALLHLIFSSLLIWRNFSLALIFPQKKGDSRGEWIKHSTRLVLRSWKNGKNHTLFQAWKSWDNIFSPLSFIFCFWLKIESHFYILLNMFLGEKAPSKWKQERRINTKFYFFWHIDFIWILLIRLKFSLLQNKSLPGSFGKVKKAT